MFMLSETAFNLAEPVLAIPQAGSLSDEEKRDYDKQLAAADALATSIARRLLADHDGRRVRLYLRTHDLPFPVDVAAGKKLDDPSLYREQFWREVSAKQANSQLANSALATPNHGVQR